MLVSAGYNMDVTYWAPTGDGLYGASNAFEAPVLLKARWEDRQEQAISSNGETFTTQAVVYVPQEVRLEGYLALGNQTTHSSPLDASDAHEIRGLITVPSIRNVVKERRALL